MRVLSQAHPMAPSESADDTIQQTVMARTLGWPVAHLPGRLRVEDVPAAFDAVPAVDPVEPTVWFGFIPPLRVYEAVHECAAARGWRLLNDPAQHQAAFELDHALPRLRELTPRSVVVHSVDEVHAAVDVVGLPTFVRGAMLSNKNKGEAACVATPHRRRERWWPPSWPTRTCLAGARS